MPIYININFTKEVSGKPRIEDSLSETLISQANAISNPPNSKII